MAVEEPNLCYYYYYRQVLGNACGGWWWWCIPNAIVSSFAERTRDKTYQRKHIYSIYVAHPHPNPSSPATL